MIVPRHSIYIGWLRILSFVLFAVSTHPAFAQSALKGTICDVYDLLLNDAGPGIATIAVAALGLGAAFGKVSWGMAITVAVGLAVMFGAAGIAQTVAGDSC